MNEKNLIAHWPLKGDTRDAAGDNHGTGCGISFCEGPGGAPGSAVKMNAPQSVIEVPDSPALRFGMRDFTMALWVKCEKTMRGPFGDLFSKFDPAARCGFNFSIAGTTPAYSGMTDTRHVHFGIDDGYIGEWEDCGRPLASNPLITSLVPFENELYCGIADADRPQDACHVFRWTGGQNWTDCGRLGHEPNHLSVQAMFVHQGKLYAGTGVWDWVRASGKDNFNPGLSHVFVYEGGSKWRDLGQVGKSVRVLCMAGFDGSLFVGLDRAGGGHCFRLDGEKWEDCGTLNGDNVEDLLTLDGALYGATHGMIYRYEGSQKWTCIGDHPYKITQIHSVEVFGGKMIIGTWPQGYVLRYEGEALRGNLPAVLCTALQAGPRDNPPVADRGFAEPAEANNSIPPCEQQGLLAKEGGDKWTNMGRLGIVEGLKEINEINDLAVHNGKLYAGVLPKAQVYRYESDGHWTLLRSLANRPEYDEQTTATWNRITCLASFRGKLFAGTGACQARAIDIDKDQTVGRVHALQTGQMVSYENDIGHEWTHLAAARRGNQLELFVNGKSVSSLRLPPGIHLDLNNPCPLLIGQGAQSAFSGAIADVRIYQSALAPDQIHGLMRA